MPRIAPYITITSLLYCTSTVAAPLSYTCSVIAENEPSVTGVLTEAAPLYKGSTFSVDRRSGHVVGAAGNELAPTKVVIDKGGDEQSYKLIWTSDEIMGTDGGKHASYLVVQDYSESAAKPFMLLLGDSRVLSGTCK